MLYPNDCETSSEISDFLVIPNILMTPSMNFFESTEMTKREYNNPTDSRINTKMTISNTMDSDSTVYETALIWPRISN